MQYFCNMNFVFNRGFPVFLAVVLAGWSTWAWDYLESKSGKQYDITQQSENTYLFVSHDCHGCYVALSELSTCSPQQLSQLKVVSFDDQNKSQKLWLRAGPDIQKFIVNKNRSSELKRKLKINGTPYFIGPKKAGLGSPKCEDLTTKPDPA